MKKLKWFWMAVLALAATPALAVTSGNVNIFLGGKTLDSNDWKAPYDDQAEFGILFDVRGEQWPVSIAADLLVSAHTESTVLGDYTEGTTELDLGVRKVFEFEGSIVHPYVGGGLAFVSGFRELAIGSYIGTEEDNGTGIWLNGGIYLTLGQSFNLGLDFRRSSGDVTLGGKTIDAGGTHAGLLLGYHW